MIINTATLLCVALFACMLLFFHLARQVGKRRDVQGSNEGDLTIGAIFAILGLLIAFSFSSAFSRFEHRRDLIVNETNSIGTAYLRIDLLPQSEQGPMREKFRRYTKLRASFFDMLHEGREPALANLTQANALQQEIWHSAITASAGPENNSARMLLIPALNSMFDIVTERTNAAQTHPPAVIFYALMALSLLCAWMSGYAVRKSSRPMIYQSVAYAAAVSSFLYLIVDLELPSQGLITLQKANTMLADLVITMQ